MLSKIYPNKNIMLMTLMVVADGWRKALLESASGPGGLATHNVRIGELKLCGNGGGEDESESDAGVADNAAKEAHSEPWRAPVWL